MLNENRVIFLKEVVDVTSIAFAQKLVEKFRGGRIYIPNKMPHEKHELRQAFSTEELEVLIENFGGNQIDVPRDLTNRAAERRRKILELRSKNMRICDIYKSPTVLTAGCRKPCAASGNAGRPKKINSTYLKTKGKNNQNIKSVCRNWRQ